MLARPFRRAPRAQRQGAPRAHRPGAPRAQRPGAPRGKRRILTRAAGLLVLAVAATGCDGGVWTRGGWPSPVTDQGQNVLGLWRGSLISSMCVGALVIGLIVYSCIFFRRRPGDELPRQVRYNLPIEVLYTVVPVILVSIFFYFTALRENDEDHFSGSPDLRVQVVGFQWAWQFNYLDDGLSITGRPGDYPQLVVPVGEKIRFYETSPDVIHSFWVIPWLFKRDVVPGHPNSFELTVTHQGTFRGKCTEYCGVDHDRMLFSVRAVSPEAYQAWLAKAKADAAAGTDKKLTVYRGPSQIPMGPGGDSQRSHQ